MVARLCARRRLSPFDLNMVDSSEESMLLPPTPPSRSPMPCPGRPKRSPIWQYFVYNEQTGKSSCQVETGKSDDEQGAGPSKKKHHILQYEDVVKPLRVGLIWGSYALRRFIRYSCNYEAHMSSALNRSSAIQRFEGSDAIEIRDGITFNFYTGLPHL